jgi:hypothetical protein
MLDIGVEIVAYLFGGRKSSAVRGYGKSENAYVSRGLFARRPG